MFSIKDLSVRGYFWEYMTELPPEYQWLYLYLQKEIEKREERFEKPKKVNYDKFITELINVSKKAKIKPLEYFESKIVPFIEQKQEKRNTDYFKSAFNLYIVKENDSMPILERIEKIMK